MRSTVPAGPARHSQRSQQAPATTVTPSLAHLASRQPIRSGCRSLDTVTIRPLRRQASRSIKPVPVMEHLGRELPPRRVPSPDLPRAVRRCLREQAACRCTHARLLPNFFVWDADAADRAAVKVAALGTSNRAQTFKVVHCTRASPETRLLPLSRNLGMALLLGRTCFS